MMSTMSYEGMKCTRDSNIMAYKCHQPWWSLRHDEGNDQNTLSVYLSLVSMKA